MHHQHDHRRRSGGHKKTPSTGMPPATTASMSSSSSSLATSRAELVLLSGQDNITTTAPPSSSLLMSARPILPPAPEDMHVCVRTPRAERVTTSCSECRRRKQKCDQNRPCGNCVKRFPQPLCEYKQNKRRNPALSNEPAFKVVLPNQDYDYSGFGGLRSPLLPTQLTAQGMLLPPMSSAPLAHSSPLLSPPLHQGDALQMLAGNMEQQQRQQQQEWELYAASGGTLLGSSPSLSGSTAGSPPATTTGASLDGWPGFNMLPTDQYGAADASNMAAMYASDPSSVSHLGLGLDNNMLLGNTSAAVQHDVLSDAFRMMQARGQVPEQLLASCNEAENLDDFYAWLRMMTWTAPGGYGEDGGYGDEGVGSSANSTAGGANNNFYQMAGPADDNLLQQLPLEGMRLDADPVRTYTKLISRFKSCLDGNNNNNNNHNNHNHPDPLAHPFTQFYVPQCLQATPLLAQVAAYTAACFLHETGHLDRMAAVAHKGRAIHLVNTQLRQQQRLSSHHQTNNNYGGAAAAAAATGSPSSTSDEAVTAVVQLIMDEWYWGKSDSLQAHLRGLREMIRLRGGLKHLGMNGLISKLAVAVIHLTALHSADVSIALSFDMSPFMQSGGGCGFDFQDPANVPFRVAHNTPLVAKLPSFAQCAEPLKMHPTTASILDDMRFLISAVLALPQNPTTKDQQKVQTTAEWIHNRIQRLPADSPITAEELQQQQEDEAEEANGLHAPPLAATGRRPSIVLSHAARSASNSPPYANMQFLSSSAHNLHSRHSSASPHMVPISSYQRAHSSSPHLQPLTPPGSTDGSFVMTAAGSNPSGYNSRQQSLQPESGHPAWLQQDTTDTAMLDDTNQFQSQQAVPLPTPPPDALYQAVRQTALLYTRAVLQRKPLSQVVSPQEFVQLWTATWRVSLTAWKGLLGVFMWLTVSLVASARDTPRDLFLKSMLSICAVQMTLEGWDVGVGALKSALRLNAWLAEGAGGRGGSSPNSNGSRSPGESSIAVTAAAAAAATTTIPKTKRRKADARVGRERNMVGMNRHAGTAGFTLGTGFIRDGGAAIQGWSS